MFEVLFRCAGGQSKSVSLPASADSSQQLTPASGTVLLVEDEDPLRNATATALRKRGFSVLSAADGHAAVEIFRDRAGDMVRRLARDDNR
jgi:PleD family two-component response regulator